MTRLRCVISISLDGFVAGPNQSVDHPIGTGGMQLHEWMFPLAAFREPHGLVGGEVNVSSRVIEATRTGIGATIMGRHMFGGPEGPWDTDNPWDGWWGTTPPFHHPVYVLTHHERDPLCLDGTTFTFVTDGIESALEQASEAAGGGDVAVAGGALAIRQYFQAGLVDEMVINLVPVLLGSGERLFDGGGTELHGLELVETIGGVGVTHICMRRA